MVSQYLINGYWKDDGSEFDGYLVNEFDEDEDDIFFFVGLSESCIKDAIKLKENTQFDFVITSYRGGVC